MSLAVEDSEFVSKLVQLLRWLTTVGLKVWSVPKSMSNSCCTSLCTHSCVREVRQSDSQNLQRDTEIIFPNIVEAEISLNSKETLNVAEG